MLLIHEAAAKAGDWAAGRCARPGSASTDKRAVAPRPSAPTSPPPLPRWGRGAGPRGSSQRPGSRDPFGASLPSCPASKPGLLRQLSLSAYREETRAPFSLEEP